MTDDSGLLVKINVAVNASLKDMSDVQLVSAAKAGDSIAFVELSRRHSKKVLSKIYSITRNWEDAEDVLQDSLLKAFTHLNGFACRSSFSVWLTRIAINSALSFLRRKRDRVEVSIDGCDKDDAWKAWEPRDLADNPENRYAKSEREELLRGAILRLPRGYRAAVELMHTQEYSANEIAHFLGISVPAAKSRLSRAKKVLRASFI